MKYNFDLGKDSIFKIFINFAIPSVLGMLAMSTAGIVDGIFIGRYVGTTGLAAVNLSYPLAALALGISIMIGVGGSTIATAEMGAGNRKEASNTYTVTLILISGFALFVTIAGSLFMDQLVGLLGADNIVKADVKEYLSYIIIFFIFFMLTFLLDAFIRADGSPLFSVTALILSAMVNIGLDYLFVARFSWGLKGAALATGISQLGAFALLLGYMMSGKSKFKLVIPHFSGRKIGKMMFNGSSELVNEMSAGTSTYVFNLILMARLGSIGVAAYSIIGYGAMVVSMIFFGVAQAIQPAVSYNYGAGSSERIKKFLKLALGVNLGTGVTMFLAMLFLAEPLAVIFAKDNSELIALTVEISRFYSFTFLISGTNIILSMFFTSMHKAKQSVLIALSRSFIALMAGLLILPRFMGDRGLWLAVLFAEAVTLILGIILYGKSRLLHPHRDKKVSKIRLAG